MQNIRTLFLFSAFAICNASHISVAQSPEPAKPTAPTLEFVFEELVTLAPDVKVGPTPWGERNIVPITGGTFSGPNIHGKVLPGGWDWQLTTADGCFQLHADYFIQTDDGAIIHVVNTGSVCHQGDPILATPIFEAPKGPHQWLNGGAYVSTVNGASIESKPTVRIRIYKIIPHP